MNSRITIRTFLLPALAALGLLVGCGPEPVRVYEVPRDSAPSVTQSAVDGVTWQIPPDWQVREPGSMRLAEFLTAEGALLSVARLPVGTPLLDNVNRWRRQLGLDPIGPGGLPAVITRTELNERSFVLIDLENDGQRFRIAQYDSGGTSWFFKLEGPSGATTASFDDFHAFLASLSFEEQSVASTTTGLPGSGAPPTAMDPADPSKGGMQALPGMGEQVASMGEASWEAPSHWHAEDPGMIRKGSWHLHGPDGAEADMAITAFPNDVGGVLANVNRWRTQIGLPEVRDPALDAAWSERTVSGYPARVLRLTGPANRSTLVAMVTVDAGRWFFKLTGDTALVDAETDTFQAFLDTVTLPGDA
ncbi:MAG: hypothetical protein ACFE0O_14610 [Opitutales bacterium]